MADTQLAPVVKTDMRYGRTRTGQRTRFKECWAARTLDGTWDFHREDARGTNWSVWHLPSVTDGSLPVSVMLCGSLDACRAAVGSGLAGRELVSRLAEWSARLNRKAG